MFYVNATFELSNFASLLKRCSTKKVLSQVYKYSSTVSSEILSYIPILYNIYHSISFLPTTYLSFLLHLKLNLKSWTYVLVLQRKHHLNFSTVIQLLLKSMFRNLKIGIFLISTLRLIKNAGNWCCRNVVIGKFHSFSWNVYNFCKNDIINNSWFILKTTADFSRLCLFCEKN